MYSLRTVYSIPKLFHIIIAYVYSAKKERSLQIHERYIENKWLLL